MPANRGLVGLVALSVLLWGVAFAGGLTVAVLTSDVTVTTTFETVDEFTPIEEPTAADAVSAAAVGNATLGHETNETDGTDGTDGSRVDTLPMNGTDPGENASDAPANGTDLVGNVSSGGDAETNATDSTGNGSAPSTATVPTAPPEDESPPESGPTAPPEDESPPENGPTAV
jgi:hypothetical protein